MTVTTRLEFNIIQKFAIRFNRTIRSEPSSVVTVLRTRTPTFTPDSRLGHRNIELYWRKHYPIQRSKRNIDVSSTGIQGCLLL